MEQLFQIIPEGSYYYSKMSIVTVIECDIIG